MSNLDLIFEIGAEEIPAGYFRTALAQMAEQLTRELEAARLPFEKLATWGSPRRLALALWGLCPHQPNLAETVTGPPLSAAYDANGSPTKAAEGFARSQGVNISDLIVVSAPKGKYLGVNKNIVGRPAAEILAEILPRIIMGLSFPKTMTWGAGRERFVRPVHWLLAVLDGETLPMTIAGAQSGQVSYGHRFLSPGPVVITSPNEYEDRLRAAQVLVNYEERRRKIKEEIGLVLSGKPDLSLVEDDELLDEVANLVEDPAAVLGSFDGHFLEMPLAVVSTAMKEHQRYFTLVDRQGRLAPYFIAISNTRARDMEVVKRGHERVLRARLDDANFYFLEDKKRKLADRRTELEGVVFHHLLGTSWQKTLRFKDVALFLADRLQPDLKTTVARAAELCKCDLASGVVKEFPSLQGIMGQAYALADGEPEAVAAAIVEHYLPNRSGGELPASTAGAILSLADKIDTVAGCFAVGLIPTGGADPFALRRQALGIINILISRGWTISLGELINKALRNLEPWLKRPPKEIRADVMEFFKTRLKNQLVGQNISPDGAEAVLSLYQDDPLAALARITALEALKKQPGFRDLAQAFKRVVNSIKKFGAKDWTPELAARLTQPEELALAAKLGSLEKQAEEHVKNREFGLLIQEIATLKGPVDAFFEKVLVDDPDQAVKSVRIALLTRAASVFEQVADFSKITT